MDMILWHNPRCSKSRATLKLLEARDLSPTVRLYLKTPPTEDEISHALTLLRLPPRNLVRKGEAIYKDLGLDQADDPALLTAMATHPILIERPILFANGKAAIGRPPEAVLDIL